MSRLTNNLYEFGEFSLDPKNRVLRRGREPFRMSIGKSASRTSSIDFPEARLWPVGR
jgi:hypothetical protein